MTDVMSAGRRVTYAVAGLASVIVVAWGAMPVEAAAGSSRSAASACTVRSDPSMVGMGAGAGQSANVADVVQVGCPPVYSGSSVTLDASPFSNHCHGLLSWSRPFPYAPTLGSQFTVTLDGDGNATAAVWGGPSCAAGTVQLFATLLAPPYPTFATAFTILPPHNMPPGVTTQPAIQVEDAMWASVATVIKTALSPAQAGRTVIIGTRELLSRCANGLTWVGPGGILLGTGVDHVNVTLDGSGNAFVVALAGPFCASGVSLITADLTTAPFTTSTTQFTTVSPQPTDSPSVIATAPSSAGGAPVGTALTDSAHVTGFRPSGMVTFYLYGPDNPGCTSSAGSAGTAHGWLGVWQVGLSQGRATVPSPGYTTTQPGIYRWVARYGGDANNNPTDSGCTKEEVIVSRATPAISTSSSAGGLVGVPIHDSAIVTGGDMPRGTVTFHLYPPSDPTCAHSSDILQTLTQPLQAGSATTAALPFTTNAVGTYHWIAIYNGDANNDLARTACGDEPVAMHSNAISISTRASRGGVIGSVIADSATVSGGMTPSGTVTFNLYGPNDPTCVATPLFTSTTQLNHGIAVSGSFAGTSVAGTYLWTAVYNGDANNPSSGSMCGADSVTITSVSSGGVESGTVLPTPATGLNAVTGVAVVLVNLGTLLYLAAAGAPARRRVRAGVRLRRRA